MHHSEDVVGERPDGDNARVYGLKAGRWYVRLKYRKHTRQKRGEVHGRTQWPKYEGSWMDKHSDASINKWRRKYGIARPSGDSLYLRKGKL
jgi:hypothetical protein